MFITPSFKKSLIVEQFQGNYLKGQAFLSSQYPGLMSIDVVAHQSTHKTLGTQQSALALWSDSRVVLATTSDNLMGAAAWFNMAFPI